MLSDFTQVTDFLFANMTALYSFMISSLLLFIPLGLTVVKLIIRLFKRIF